MTSLHSCRKWMATIYLLVIPSVNLQVAMYPMFAQPMPVALPMPVPVPIMMQEEECTTLTSTTSTTTTTERSQVGIAFPVPMPMPMPMPVPFAFPAFPDTSCQGKKRPKNCPPCPPCLCQPSCTPAFFSYCSPCHKKCRCRSTEDTPTPIPPKPYGVAVPVPHMIGPPPVVVIPFPPPPPYRRPPPIFPYSSSSDDTNTDSTDDSSSSSYEKKRKRRTKLGHLKRRPIYRSRFSSLEIDDNALVEPVLTYLTRNGHVKIKRRLSKNEAAELMDDRSWEKISVLAGEDDRRNSRILISSMKEKNKEKKWGTNHRRKQVALTKRAALHMLGEGKKELVFRAPNGKKISNLSVSFHISE